MSPEAEIAQDIATRLTALMRSLTDTLDLTGPVPANQAAFDRLGKIERVASTSLLKVVEQIEDQLARLFRTILHLLGVDARNLYAADIASHMDRLGIVADPGRWVAIVQLRNRLVHDYPIDPAAQFSRLKQTHEATAFLRDTTERALAFLNDRNLP